MKLTSELIHASSSHPCGDGFTKDQLAILGVKWPPSKGWLTALVGKEIPDADFAEFQRIGLERRRKHILRATELQYDRDGLIFRLRSIADELDEEDDKERWQRAIFEQAAKMLEFDGIR